MRILFPLALVFTCGCATPSKMAWPNAAPTEESKWGVGGALEPEPTVVTIGEKKPAQPEVYEALPLESDVQPSRMVYKPRRIELRWPLPATGVNSLFGPRTDPVDGRGRFHYGVDLEGEYGAPIRAAEAGTIVYAGWQGGHGRQIVVDHIGGYRTSYSHLSRVLVYPGMYVSAGQLIGAVGNSGRSTGPHLHFEITRYGRHIDPLDLLGRTLLVD